MVVPMWATVAASGDGALDAHEAPEAPAAAGTGTALCCARVRQRPCSCSTTDRVMKSRRLTRSPRRRARGGRRNTKTECLCGDQVNDQVKLRWLLDREVGRFRPTQNFVNIVASARKRSVMFGP